MKKYYVLISLNLIVGLIIGLAISHPTENRSPLPATASIQQTSSEMGCGQNHLNQVTLSIARETITIEGIIDLPEGITAGPDLATDIQYRDDTVVFHVSTPDRGGNMTACGTPSEDWLGRYNASLTVPEEAGYRRLTVMHDSKPVKTVPLNRLR